MMWNAVLRTVDAILMRDADPGNERRYFAAARKVGMIELAIELAEKYDVEPKTLTTASKEYADKDPNLSLHFG